MKDRQADRARRLRWSIGKWGRYLGWWYVPAVAVAVACIPGLRLAAFAGMG